MWCTCTTEHYLVTKNMQMETLTLNKISQTHANTICPHAECSFKMKTKACGRRKEQLGIRGSKRKEWIWSEYIIYMYGRVMMELTMYGGLYAYKIKYTERVAHSCNPALYTGLCVHRSAPSWASQALVLILSHPEDVELGDFLSALLGDACPFFF